MTPYYQDDLVTIYHGDCRQMLLQLDTSGMVVVSDPPYGISWDTDGSTRGGKVYDRIVGDDRPFDPSHLIALRLPTVLFGANHYADRLPSSPSWLVWHKRDGMAPWSQSDCELAWSNIGGPARILVHDWWSGAAAITKDGGRWHPTQKPVGLMADVIRRCPDGVVLDPYMGSGTTLVAAKSLGRRAIGIEIDERYCEAAATRCSQEVLGLSA